MYGKIGIVASKNERADKCKWYNFIKKTKPTWFLSIQTEVEFVIAYENQNITRIFNREQVKVVIPSNCCPRFDSRNLYIATGEKIYNRHIPVALKKISKMRAGCDTSVAVVDSELSPGAMVMLDKLQNDFRYITLVTSDLTKAEAVAESLYDEYGIAISIAETGQFVNCDIAVNISRTSYKFPRNTIIFDKIGEHNIENNGRVINNFSVTPKIKLPVNVNQIAVVDALEALGAVNTGFKTTGFLYDGKSVDI